MPRGGNNPKTLESANMGLSMITREAKRLAKSRRAASPVRAELIPEYMDKLSNYLQSQIDKGKAPTIAGMALSMGVSTDTFRRMHQGELDYVIDEYRIVNDLPPDCTEHINEDGEVITLVPFSEWTKRALDVLQDFLESNCYQLKGNQVGSIFGLKAKFGWQEDTPQQTTVNQLVIADKDKANKMLSMLQGE